MKPFILKRGYINTIANDPLSNPLGAAKRKGKYRLFAKGIAALRASVQAHRPWEKSTGPRTGFGKLIVRQNAITHGMYSSIFRHERKEFLAHMRKMRYQTNGR